MMLVWATRRPSRTSYKRATMSLVLETDRIALRQFTEADAPLLFALDSDPEVMRYVGRFALPNKEAYCERIRNYFRPYYAKSPHFGFWLAELRSTREFIGWFHLRPALDYRFARETGFADGEYDIGFRLSRSLEPGICHRGDAGADRARL